jgi:CheY-like chemotaxis protein
MVTHPSILLIEDSPGECELFRLALIQTSLDVTLYTEHDAEAAFHFLQDRASYHPKMSPQYSPSEAAGVISTARNIPPAQPSARQDALFPERGPSATARCASTGDQSGHPPSLPSLILLDLNLRGQEGCNLLKRLRSDPRFAAIPAVVFTTSDESSDLASAYANGANGFVVKPGTYDQLVECVRDLCYFWLKWNRTSEVLVRC